MEIVSKVNCSGCSACFSICSTGAIKMKEDGEGFLYPFIDSSLCTNCGLCNKVCAFHEEYDRSNNLNSTKIFAVRHKNRNVRLTSRSGGVFTALSDIILANNGVIYGVGFDKNFEIIHKRAITNSQRDEFKCSKYVQSDVSNIFAQVKNDLKNEMPVLFSGTPCQTAGLYSYLKLKKVNIQNLLLCDIVCDGVPSPLIWREYKKWIERKYKRKIIRVEFRDKDYGWASHYETFLFDNNKKITLRKYRDLFYNKYGLRPACSSCHYTNFIRPSDITLADFWGWEKLSLSLNSDNEGVSLVLINTNKGSSFFDMVKKDLDYLQSDEKTCLQPRLESPPKASVRREGFWKDYNQRGIDFILAKYCRLDWKTYQHEIKKKVKYWIKKNTKY
jgi:coenzyme F420-reducing hydrogenase beta subunit